MHGNVFEWCLDWYGGINRDPATDWIGASSGSDRVQRGGFGCRSSDRYYYHAPSSSYGFFGFRLSRALAE